MLVLHAEMCYSYDCRQGGGHMLVHPVLRTLSAQIHEPHVYGNEPGNRAGLCAASSAAKIICAFPYALIPLLM